MPNDVINTITIGNTTYDIGGSGHTIEKSDGTDMTQRANLQFVDATVTDDSVNDRTKIENVKTITNESELDNLPDGIYIGPTDEGLPFDAGDIPYDNTESGLSADSVQEAIDEIDDIITTDETIIEGNPINFSTLSAQNAESTIIDLEPIQDLHGYDKPWVGGAGKNLLPMILADIKSVNTSGTWSGNVYTYYDVAFIILTDADDNVIGIKATGTPTGTAVLRIIGNTINLPDGSYIMNGCPSGGDWNNKYALNFNYDSEAHADVGSGIALTISSSNQSRVEVLIRNGFAIPTGGLIFYPMIRKSTETDPTFAPYTNIASISGRTEIGILGCGKNWFDEIEQGSWNATWGTKTNSNIRCRSTQMYNLSSSQYTLSVESNVSGKTPLIVVQEYTYSDNRYTNTFDSGWQSSGYTFTAIQDRFYAFLFSFDGNPEVTPSSFKNIQLEKGNQPTTYEPYTISTDLTISLGQTVYGGTLDVENGVLVVDRGFETFDGNVDEQWGLDNDGRRVYISQTDADVTVTNSALSDKFPSVTTGQTYQRVYGVSLGIKNGGKVIQIANGQTMVLEDWKTWLASNNVQVCYPLATPITINLTPHQISLLEGVNNISTTGDKITLTYRDGKMATLKDIKDSLESSKPVYSSVETVIGTYLNKPLYSKTYQIQFSSSNSYYFDVPSTMDIKFVFGGVYSTRFDFIPFGYGGSGGDMVQCYRFSDTQFRIQNAYYASRMYCDVTLQYTKSTD